MSSDLDRGDDPGIQRWLDREEMLRSTVLQLRKDLSIPDERLEIPPLGEEAFESLRGAVLPELEALQAKGPHALQVVLYRIDLPEAHVRRTMAQGGLHALAGECVLRALQKVLTRMRSAGHF